MISEKKKSASVKQWVMIKGVLEFLQGLKFIASQIQMNS